MSKTSQVELISIVIINYSGANYLANLIGAFKHQTYENLEIIVVDSGSSDGSRDVLRVINGIKIIYSKNLGYSSACNLGIENSLGEYVLILNSDTIVDHFFVKKLHDEFQNKKLDVIAPQEKKFNGEFLGRYTSTIDLLGYPTFLFGSEFKHIKPFYLSGVCLFCTKKLYSDTEGLDSNFFMYFEETDWFWRLNLYNKRFQYSDDVYICHAGANRKISINAKTSVWRNQNNMQMLIKNYSRLSLLIVLPVFIIINIFELLFFLIILKPKIAMTYPQGWIYNLKNIKPILAKRKIIQEKRTVSDFEIMKKMYKGSLKLKHLMLYLKQHAE